jgi:F420-0:gamma-glutamyl ligase-like protein
MGRYKLLNVSTEYWRPGDNYIEQIVENVKGKIADGDIITISEKAIATASKNIVDEDDVKPLLGAKLIARFWMRIVWGYFLGTLCHFGGRLLHRLRNYPHEMGSRHKQVALQHAGLLQALMFGSEGGIDGSNLAYSYVSLPLENADEIAQRIRRRVRRELGKSVCIMIVDTDKTYSFRNFHFTPRVRPVKGIQSVDGVLLYVVGRVLRLRKRATPLAVAGCSMSAEIALEIAEVANRVRGFGAGRTVWGMAERFNVQLTDVSWELLETVKHKPIVVVRTRR